MTLLKWPEAIPLAQSRRLDAMLDKLASAPWFASPEANRSRAESAIGQFLSGLGLEALPVRWVHPQELAPFIQGYELIRDPVWPRLYGIPETIRQAAGKKEAQDALSFLLDDFPEYLFHAIYDGAFRAFEPHGEPVIRHAVAAALYITGLSAAWYAVCEQVNPLEPLADSLRMGYLPLGVKNGVFHLH